MFSIENFLSEIENASSNNLKQKVINWLIYEQSLKTTFEVHIISPKVRKRGQDLEVVLVVLAVLEGNRIPSPIEQHKDLLDSSVEDRKQTYFLKQNCLRLHLSGENFHNLNNIRSRLKGSLCP